MKVSPGRCLCCALAIFAAACSRTPGPPKLKLDPATAAAAALQTYDTNHDGQLDHAELEACPALASGLKAMDTNGDGAIQAAELTARLTHLLNAGAYMITGRAEVTLDGKPLPGAHLVFEPEAFMGGTIQPAQGDTDATGAASIVSNDARFPGYYLGYYKVRITLPTGGKELLPERYNTHTTLGIEATDEVTDVGTMQFQLTSK